MLKVFINKLCRRRFNAKTIVLTIIVMGILSNIIVNREIHLDTKNTRRYIEEKLEKALKLDKGTGCQIPYLDPFAKEITQFDKQMPRVICTGEDWVKCNLSECRVLTNVLEEFKEVVCEYRDIIYISDAEYKVGSPTMVYGDESYILKASDHVKVSCQGKRSSSVTTEWTGLAIGFRESTKASEASASATKEPINVLILTFDSTSKNGFMRKMPKSYKYITEKLKATILNGYNIVGDGTPAALFPILTGKTELELPDMRKFKTKETLDSFPFIFYELKKLGYRTAFFEDRPDIGTFQYRFNGFKFQPTDHYLRAFFMEEQKSRSLLEKFADVAKYCIGATPRYQLMMDITQQFFELLGRHFCFTFISDISHDDFNMISTADNSTVRFLEAFQNAGHLENTILFLMGDHGPRFAYLRDTLQGKLEERLPLMTIHLPRALTKKRPGIERILATNAEVLTTPHDIHATILDALEMEEHMNPYKIKGADLKRGLSLLQPIPSNRSCSEAGIDSHWCTCLTWLQVSDEIPQYTQAAQEFVQYINKLLDPVREFCEPRILTVIHWVTIQQANEKLIAFNRAQDTDGFLGSFDAKTKRIRDNYQIKVSVGPGNGVFEATAKYIIADNQFIFNTGDISRINAYGDEPSCISNTHPHLNMFCFCKNVYDV